jgi:hypothetical protein
MNKEKKTFRIELSVDVTTHKSIDDVVKGFERSIFRGLDNEGLFIAAPSDVKINYCKEVPIWLDAKKEPI